ncbi:MAG: acid protease [Flavobacteriaceae bacterium]|nr:acid protease [Flavobacteriaceae bacterium]
MYRHTFTRINISKTKHLLCRARINGKKAKLLIDTGASNSCIHSELQDHFKLEKKGDPFDASGASEGKMEAVLTAKCIIELGRKFKGEQAFVLLDLNHVNTTLSSQGANKIDGIIGADFLKKNKAIIDYGHRKLFL